MAKFEGTVGLEIAPRSGKLQLVALEWTDTAGTAHTHVDAAEFRHRFTVPAETKALYAFLVKTSKETKAEFSVYNPDNLKLTDGVLEVQTRFGTLAPHATPRPFVMLKKVGKTVTAAPRKRF